MNLEQATELADNFFSFDYLGDAMMDVRRELDNEELQEKLANALVDVICEEEGDDEKELFIEAAMARVRQFVKSAKSAEGTGCGK
jgi:hypothetical protein